MVYSTDMKLFGLEITKADKPTPKVIVVGCYGCARTFMIAVKEVRVYNYCNNCK